MVGMNQMKKKMVVGIVIGAAIGVVGIGLTLWWAITTINSYKEGTNKEYNRLYTQDVAVLNRDVIQGEVITSDMVTTVNVHKRTVPTGALNLSEIPGNVAKFNIPASIPITASMVTKEIVSADVRDQEINTVVMPSDLVTGDYVDIRIMYPSGTDYIVLAQKKVGEISGSTMWLQLTEDERLILNGAMVDSYLNEGTKLYATKYTDPEAQIKLDDETDAKLKGYMLKAIASTFNLSITDTDITNFIKNENGEKTDATTSGTTTANSNTAATVETAEGEATTADTTNGTATSAGVTTSDLKKVEDIFGLLTKYKNFASTLTRTSENYQPNTQIIAMMNSNANVLQEAKDKLSTTARQNIENSLSTYKSQQGDDYSNVVSGAQASIDDQKAQREALLNGSATSSESGV